jgi:hypothetical protein
LPAAIAISVAAQLLQSQGTSAHDIDGEHAPTACPADHHDGACATCTLSSPLPQGEAARPRG